MKSMTLSELQDHGRITEILSKVRKIEEKLDQLERRLDVLLNDQQEPSADTQEHDE